MASLVYTYLVVYKVKLLQNNIMNQKAIQAMFVPKIFVLNHLIETYEHSNTLKILNILKYY